MQSYDLNLLVALVALLETQSVTKAADRLHLSVPATSRVLGRLRETFGDALLVRAGSRLVATARGERLLEPARSVVDAARALRQVGAPQALAAIGHRFVVRVPDPLAVVIAAPLSAALAEVMPAASLALVSDVRGAEGALRDGELDLQVGPERLAGPELRETPFAAQARVGVVRRGHPLTRGRLTVARLARTPRVAVARHPSDADAVETALRDAGLDARAVLSVPNAYAAVATAARSDLLACVPIRIAQAVADPLRLTLLDLPVALPPERWSMAWHPRTDAAPGHAWLRARLQAAIERPAARTEALSPSRTRTRASPARRR